MQGLDRDKAIDLARVFFGLTPLKFQGNPEYLKSLRQELGNQTRMQVAFAPTRRIVRRTTLAANDPFVHYTIEDLRDYKRKFEIYRPRHSEPLSRFSNLGQTNERYFPWQGPPGKSQLTGDPSRQDSLTFRPDDWKFPIENLTGGRLAIPSFSYPNIGYIGRVHRGTPWQTIYLKSVSYAGNWAEWAGHPGTHPTNDWKFPELFTVALNENAERGLLSVNQRGEAAWAAALAGITVRGNYAIPSRRFNSGNAVQHFIADTGGMIEPGSSRFATLVNGIRKAQERYPQSRFPSLGSILSTPELTMESPYLMKLPDQFQNHLDDETLESIPQQILSLLKLEEPRFTIYVYGQSLKPAEASIVRVPGPYFQMCTNYAVSGEVAAKYVVRLEGSVGSLRAVVEQFRYMNEPE